MQGNIPNLPPEKLQALLAAAGKRLGVEPQALGRQLQSGDLSGVLGSLSPEQAAKLQRMVGDPKSMERLLREPAVQTLLTQLKNR